MNIQRIIAGTTLAALSVTFTPTAPVLANGAASTRNILLLGGAAATYLIIQHNKKVHAQQAEQAHQQAAAEESSNNAWAAYHSEANAYNKEAALNSDLKREVAYQHDIVVQQQKQLAAAGLRPVSIAQHPASAAASSTSATSSQQVATTSYGWGTL